jgi:hypothetical protein
MRIGNLVPRCLKPYLKPLYRSVIAAVDPMHPASLPEWLWGLETGRIVETPESLKALHADAVFYQPVPYQVLPYIRSVLRPNDIFFDLGSGMGRMVLYVAGSCKLRKVVGVEYSSELVRVAKANLTKVEKETRLLTPLALIEDDVAEVDLSEGTVYCLFNPFGEETLRKVLENIRLSLQTNPRHIKILYINAVCAKVLDDMVWLEPSRELPRFIGKTSCRSWAS